ncbi:MAG: non-canonical purine NTP diphosphatase [Lentimicrobiaceae bacterium]|nr:non-canonical purine NTP diphosphatase [Lentimicrobiaceae bacterium]
MNKTPLVFATNNAHKIEELRNIIGKRFEVLSLKDIGCEEDIPETADTLEGNASLKSKYIFEKYELNCFGDDTGLEIAALNGKPGVYSARYAGENKSFDDNIDKVLNELAHFTDRTACFRTVISLIFHGKEFFFEGKVCGILRHERAGGKGFGYDPIFQPKGYNITFAEMGMEEKNRISHRGMAVNKLIDFLMRAGNS